MKIQKQGGHGARDPSPEVLGEYRGKWVAVLRGVVVASGARAIEVLRTVDRDHPNEKPVVYRVPSGEVMLL
jgi:Family of unknown function (DUF5678)